MTKNAQEWANVLDGGVQSWMENGLPVNAGLFGATKEAFKQAMAQAWDEAIEAAAGYHDKLASTYAQDGMERENYWAIVSEKESARDIRALPNPYKDKENV